MTGTVSVNLASRWFTQLCQTRWTAVRRAFTSYTMNRVEPTREIYRNLGL